MSELNNKLGPQLRRPLADLVLTITGTAALADTDGELGARALHAAHEAAVTLYQMGCQTEPDLLAVETDWYQSDFRGQNGDRPTVKQLTECAAKWRAPTRPAAQAARNGNGKPAEVAAEVF